MDTVDLERFEASREWFNSFFDGCKKIFDEVARRLEPPTNSKGPSYYYPKFVALPTIPPYLSMGCDHKGYYIEVISVLDSAVFDGTAHFKKEPSMVLSKHSDGGRGLWIEQNGLKVMSGQVLDPDWDDESRVLSGLIDNANGTRFQAFQVFFDSFSQAKDLTQSVDREILEPLRRLGPL